jgi:Holliday junction resolvase RusA-like endonuclease
MDAPSTSFADPPFACPPDVVIDLPAPISVNAVRRVDWSSMARTSQWKGAADAYIYQAKCRRDNPLKLENIQRFEITITFDENQTGIDLDNGVKGILDYLVDREVIEDDGPKHMRKLTVTWGEAPEGTRVTVRPCE